MKFSGRQIFLYGVLPLAVLAVLLYLGAPFFG